MVVQNNNRIEHSLPHLPPGVPHEPNNDRETLYYTGEDVLGVDEEEVIIVMDFDDEGKGSNDQPTPFPPHLIA